MYKLVRMDMCVLHLIKNGFSLHHSSTWCMGIQAGWKGGIVQGSNGSRGAERKMLTQLCPGRLCWKFPSIHWLLNRAPHMRTHWGCDGRPVLLELHSVIQAHEWTDYKYEVCNSLILHICFLVIGYLYPYYDQQSITVSPFAYITPPLKLLELFELLSL